MNLRIKDFVKRVFLFEVVRPAIGKMEGFIKAAPVGLVLR